MALPTCISDVKRVLDTTMQQAFKFLDENDCKSEYRDRSESAGSCMYECTLFMWIVNRLPHIINGNSIVILNPYSSQKGKQRAARKSCMEEIIAKLVHYWCCPNKKL